MIATPERPNVILITTDQQRWDALGINDPTTDLQTPCLDALARGGVNFSRAFSSCPVCIPARRTLLSGLHPTAHGLRRYQDELEWNTPFSLPGELSRNGWQTELIGKLHLYPQRKRYGYDHMVRLESSNDRWDSPSQMVNDWADDLKLRGYANPNCMGVGSNSRVARPWTQDESLHYTSWLGQRAVDFVTKYRDPSMPYFMHLSFIAPHPPLTPPQFYWDKYINRHTRPRRIGDWTAPMKAGLGIDADSYKGPFTDREIHEAVAGYYGLVSHIDEQVRYVLNRTFDYGTQRAKEPTLIIYTSDHGEMLGDHELWRKSLPYNAASQVPFFISAYNMNIQKGITCDDLVGLEDVAATVLDMCGLQKPNVFNNDLNSISLAHHLRGESGPKRERFFGECMPRDHHYTICNNEKYIRFTQTGEEQLFNLTDDPYECHDLSADVSRLESHRAAFTKHCEENGYATELDTGFTPCANKPPRALYGTY